MSKDKKHQITSRERRKVKKFIENIDDIRGRGTELVSVYVPAGYDLNNIIQHLQEEQSTAQNIKSKRTRENVIDALERMIRHLRVYKKTPENGLAVFAGNIAEQEGQQDVEVWSIEPPVPINQRLYRCDKEFVTEPLKEIAEDRNVYGMLVIDKREADLALLKGKTIIPLTKSTSNVPGKTKAGGQCLSPDTLITLPDESRKPLKKIEVGEKVLSVDMKPLSPYTYSSSKVTDRWKTKKKVYVLSFEEIEEKIVCSPDHEIFVFERSYDWIPTEGLREEDRLALEDEDKGRERVLGLTLKNIEKREEEMEMIDISVESGNFLANGVVVHNSAQRFERLREGAAKDFYRRVAEKMKKSFHGREDIQGILIGGPGHTKNEFVNQGNLPQDLKDKIITMKDLSYTGQFGLEELLEKCEDVLSQEEVVEEKQLMKKFFELLGSNPGKVEYGPEATMKVLKIGAVDTLLLSEELSDDRIHEFEKEAQKVSSDVKIISEETREGKQLPDLGGVAAILRYAVNT